MRSTYGSGGGGDALHGRDVVGLRGLEQETPGGHVGALAEQGTALALGHATPDPPLDLVVQRLSEALGAHGAPGAQLLSTVLSGAPDEQLVRAGLVAQGLGGPVLVPSHVRVPPR